MSPGHSHTVTIAIESGRIVVSGPNGGALRIADIADVAVEKVGMLDFDELFLIVRDQSGEGVVLGERDEGFSEAEQILRSILPGFPSDWYARADQGPTGLRLQIWPTPIT